MEPTVSKRIVFNLFEGNITALQKAVVDKWLQNPEHQELYFQWLDEWELANPQFLPDADQAFIRSLNSPSSTVSRPEVEQSFQRIRPLGQWRALYSVAAAAVLILIAGLFLFRDNLLTKRYETAYGQVKTVTLPDGSRVTLNGNSLLKVKRFGFGKGDRAVWLRGEAEFSVIHTANHNHFVVHTPDQLEVQVLGTEFIVFSRGRGSKVVLTKGSVRLRQTANPAIAPVTIAPGDVATLTTKGRLELKHHQPVASFMAWKEHRFVFENTSLTEISQQLNEQFGVRIILADSSMAQRTLGGTFRAERATDILQVLTDLLNIQVQRIGDRPETYELTPSTH